MEEVESGRVELPETVESGGLESDDVESVEVESVVVESEEVESPLLASDAEDVESLPASVDTGEGVGAAAELPSKPSRKAKPMLK